MRTFSFSVQEIREIAAAAFVLAFVFGYPFAGSVGLSGFAFDLMVIFVILSPAFILHELSHKLMAQSYGCWSEFRLWKEGLFFSLLMKFLVPNSNFVFAAPGATYFSPYIGGLPHLKIRKEQEAKISLAGPMMNVMVALFFLALVPVIGDLGVLTARMNLQFAFFNMLPIWPLDGSKVASWNFWLWLGVSGGIMLMQGALSVLF